MSPNTARLSRSYRILSANTGYDGHKKHPTVLDQIGEITVDAPDDADSETIGKTLTNNNEYETVDEGYDAVDGITRRTTTDNPFN